MIISPYKSKEVIKSPSSSWLRYWTPQTAVVENTAPTQIVLTYPKKVRQSDIVAGNFAISGNACSEASIDVTGKIVTLTFSIAFIYGEIISLVANNTNISVTNNVAAEAESLAYFGRITTPPSTAYKSAMNEFIKTGKDSGWLANSDIIRSLFNVDEQAALLNIKQDAFNDIKNGTPAFNKFIGYIGSSGNYLKSGYVVQTSNVKLQQNDGCILVWNTRKPVGATNTTAIAASTTDGSYNTRLAVEPLNNSNKIRTSWGATSDPTQLADLIMSHNYMAGLVGVQYKDGNISVIRNGVVEKTNALAIGYFPNQEIYELTGRSRSSVIYYNSDLGFVYVGSSLSESQHLSLYNAARKLFLKLASLNTGLTDIDFHIILGDSNCGRDLVANVTNANYKGAITNAKIYNTGYATESAWNDLNGGVNTMCVNPANATEVGAESALSYNLINYHSRPVWIYKHGVGSSSIGAEWNPSTGINYKTFIRNLEAAYVRAIAEGKRLRLKSITIIHGENDIASYSAAYAANQSALIAQIKTDLQSLYGLIGYTYTAPKIIITKMKYGTGSAADTIRAAQAAYCDIPANNATLLITDAYSFIADNIHYTADSCAQMGVDIYNVVKDL